MAQNQREMNRLRHILEEKDREIEMLRENEENSGRVDPGIIEEYSHRVTELEEMVKELAVSNAQAAPQDTRISELEEMVMKLTVSNAQAAPQDTRISELEEMVRELAVSNARVAPQDTRINELEEMVKKLAVSNAQAAPQDTRISELEEMVKKLAVSNAQVAPQETRISELEEMVRELAVSNARAAPQETRISELEEMVKELAVSNTRVAPRDTRVTELAGMVKGLTEELLDLKAEVRKLGKVLEGKEELKPKPEIRRARPVRPAPEMVVKRPVVPPQPANQSVEPELDTATIMQPDGTLAEEPRMNHDDLIVAGNRPAKMYQQKANREYRGKEERKPLIYADEDDTVEIKKK